jgi:hypothetical protein
MKINLQMVWFMLWFNYKMKKTDEMGSLVNACSRLVLVNLLVAVANASLIC